MKKVLLACLLLAFLFCAACGQQKEETAVPMPADGGDEAQILHDPGTVGGGGHAALLIGAAAAVDDIVGFVA